ncbi:MAG TPA: bifunctional lysylphosphatidylglycerol flippase/synthetase MprF [Gemmatimonadales bacterium]|nr:bifunctional lysylphosphatidylglycerol flippase/synthetase MprF [Gemmatimonadales bacterium]
MTSADQGVGNAHGPAPGTPPRGGRFRRWLGVAVALGLCAAAAALVRHDLAAVSWQAAWRQFRAIPGPRLILAAGLTALGYGALTLYDTLALRAIGHALPYRRAAFAALVSYGFSNSLAFGPFTSAAVRGRIYSAWGLTGREIAGIAVFAATTLWIGLLLLAGLAALAEPRATAGMLHVPAAAVLVAGALALGLALIGLSWPGRRPGATTLTLARAGTALADWLCAAGALFALLPLRPAGFLGFAGLFAVAQGAALLSSVPGGLGVLEGVVALAAPPAVGGAALAGGFLAFRLVYYLIPLGAAGLALAAFELWRVRRVIRTVLRTARELALGAAPSLLAVATFAAGAVLLFSGATPALGWRLRLLRTVVPLPLLEASHFLASVAGLGLLILAWGLHRRLNAAWGVSLVVLLAAAVASLLKGFDYEEASLILLVVAALVPLRRRFHRTTRLLDEPLSPVWVAAVLVTVGASIGLGLFAFRHVAYANSLWWRFAFGADAPRFLRATVGVLVSGLLWSLLLLLRPARPARHPLPAADLDRVEPLIAAAPEPAANLALLGDKTLLFHERERAFLMYAVRGRSWIAMGDPVGPPEEAAELAWRFRELVDRHAGWPVFYQASLAYLPRYLDLGLTALKIGEEARVPLETFGLEGQRRAGLRRWRNVARRAGCTVEIVPPGAPEALLVELRRVSDEWLRAKRTREKRFSLGSFSPAYLRRFPIAVVRCRGRVVAFANLWTTAASRELTVDLMRYGEEAPSNVMTYLLTELMLWGRVEGFRWFSLGMAPLSGLPDRALASFWNRLGAFIYAHGETFYGFQGLREFKDRFDPVWVPRYLASPGGLALPFILGDTAALIGGGLKGVFAK